MSRTPSPRSARRRRSCPAWRSPSARAWAAWWMPSSRRPCFPRASCRTGRARPCPATPGGWRSARGAGCRSPRSRAGATAKGYSLDKITLAVRVMAALGARVHIFTNAVGAIREDLRPADVLLATGHLNFIGKRGLLTPDELRERDGARRVAEPYSLRLRAALGAAAKQAGVTLHQGVLMGGHGPTYETAAEVRMARTLGADVACMSTVHEVTLAAQLGCEAASLSCVTNRATGLSDTPLTHAEVTVVADQVAVKLRAILERFLEAEGRGR